MSTLQPTSELEAVNRMLRGIGSSPVSTLEDSGDVDVVSAVSTLRDVSRQVQQKGWHFNTEKEFPLVPASPSKEISVPSNCLRVDTVSYDFIIDVVQRGSRLYNRKDRTYQFDKTIKVDMVVFLPFNELPEAARNYIAIKATRMFQDAQLGSEALHVYQLEDELEALADLEEAESDTGDLNILTGNYSSLEIVDRNI